MYHTHRVRSKKQRTKAQRQNRSKVQKRSTPPEPRQQHQQQKSPSQPPKLLDLENVKDALALYIHNSIKINEQPKKSRRPLFSRQSSHPSLFDARDTRSTTIPTVPEIRNYVRDIIDRRRLSSPTVVVSVVLLTRTGIRIRSSNWARLLLVAFLLANKEAEDVYNVWNVRFLGIIPDLPLYEINLLEMEFLKLIKYRLHVEPNTFREYTDRLRQFLEDAEKNNPENGISENLEIIEPEIPDQTTPKKVKKGKIENGLDELQKQIFSKVGLATSGEAVKVLLKSPLLVKSPNLLVNLVVSPLLVKSPLRPT